MAEEEVALRVALKDRLETSRGLSAVKQDIHGVGDATDSTGRRTSRMGALSKKAALGVGALAVAAAGAGKALYGVGATFDDVSDTIRVGTGATGKQLGALEASAKRIGRSVPAAFSDIGPVVADVNTRLGLTGPALEKVSKQILEAGRITGTAIDINAVSGAFNAFQVQGKDTAGAMDTLYQVSQATGLGINELATSVSKNGAALKGFGFSLEESASWIGTLDKAGLDGNKTLGTLSRAMSSFAADGKDPQKALRATVDEIDRLGKAGKDAAAINLASEVFGTRGATQFVGAIKAGKVDLDALTKATGATSDTILKAGRDTADFAEHWQVFKNRALIALEPIATRVFGALGDGMQMLNRDVVPAVKTFIAQIKSGEGVGGRFAAVFGTVRDALSRIAGVIRGALSGSAGDASTYLGSIVDTFRSVVSIVQSLWDRFGGTITRYTQTTFQNIKTVIGGALKVVSGIFKTVAALLKGDWSGAWNGIKQILSGAVAILKGTVKQLWNFIRSAFSIGMSAVKGLFSGMWDGLKNLASRGIDGIVGFVRRLPGRIVSVATGAFDGIKDAFRGAINWIIDKWNGLEFSVPGVSIAGKEVFGGTTIGTPNIPRLAQGGIVQATPGGTLAVIGEGGRDEAVIPLPQPMSLSAPDVSLDDVPGLAPAAARTLVVPVYLDRTQIGEAVLDDFEARAARR